MQPAEGKLSAFSHSLLRQRGRVLHWQAFEQLFAASVARSCSMKRKSRENTFSDLPAIIFFDGQPPFSSDSSG
jgi:hypothetical protein